MMQRISDLLQKSTLQLVLGCTFSEVPLASDAVHDFLLRQGWIEEDVVDCELALVEACNNAIKYAKGPARDLPVCVEVECSVDEVEFRVTDHTPGFEWPERVQLPDLESETGRGLYLIHSVMDYVQYIRNPSDNTLVMRRRRGERSR